MKEVLVTGETGTQGLYESIVEKLQTKMPRFDELKKQSLEIQERWEQSPYYDYLDKLDYDNPPPATDPELSLAALSSFLYDIDLRMIQKELDELGSEFAGYPMPEFRGKHVEIRQIRHATGPNSYEMIGKFKDSPYGRALRDATGRSYTSVKGKVESAVFTLEGGGLIWVRKGSRYFQVPHLVDRHDGYRSQYDVKFA